MPTSHTFYIKTAEHCNLDCSHCFTRGSKAPKKFFNVDKTLRFVKDYCTHKSPDEVIIVLHGGEPMLAPTEDLHRFCEGLEGLPVSFSIQTNLVYKLTDAKLKFLTEYFKHCLGTSWDYEIRFKDRKDENLWEENVTALLGKGFSNIGVCVSLTDQLIRRLNPGEILERMTTLGVHGLILERVTPDGHASNGNTTPYYEELDLWIRKMWDETVLGKYYTKLHTSLFAEVAKGVFKGQHTGMRCRDCQQTMFTINADGTVSGCPNTAPYDIWGHIDEGPGNVLKSPKRQEAIMCEMERNPICYTCDLFDVCNGDCHQLKWQGDNCPAPKMLMKYLKNIGYNETIAKIIRG